MIVDDDEDILDLFGDFLEKEGYKGKTFLNPFKALEEIQTGPHEYSMIITDVRMSGISGIELVRILSKTNHKIKVILTSAFDLDGTDMNGIVHDKFIGSLFK
jgi:two-component system, cell cycle response regulator CpdR